MLLALRFVFPSIASTVRWFCIVCLSLGNEKKSKNLRSIFAEVPALQDGVTDLEAEKTSAAF